MKISFYNIGCKVNFADISEICSRFERAGHEVVPFGKPADLILINTCTVTRKADADSRKMIRRAIRRFPDAYIAVLGCYSQLHADEIASIEGVDAVLGTNEKYDIQQLVDGFEKQRHAKILVSSLEDTAFHGSCSVDEESHTRVVMKIQDGCDYNCSYCTVPLARGRSRSMLFDRLEGEFRRIARSGAGEIVLSGINLGEYRSEAGETFIDLLRLIESLQLNVRFRISSIEPNLVSDEIIDIVSRCPSICPHFHIPLQSGSDQILRLMRRQYTSSDFTRLVDKIKSAIPVCAIGVDVITGFPGETEGNFAETRDLLASLDVSYLHVFTYSERQDTAAAALGGNVPYSIRKERTAALRSLSDEKKAVFYNSRLGSVVTVIPEDYDTEANMLKGWSENYIRVAYRNTNYTDGSSVKVKLMQLKGLIVIGEIF